MKVRKEEKENFISEYNMYNQTKQNINLDQKKKAVVVSAHRKLTDSY